MPKKDLLRSYNLKSLCLQSTNRASVIENFLRTYIQCSGEIEEKSRPWKFSRVATTCLFQFRPVCYQHIPWQGNYSSIKKKKTRIHDPTKQKWICITKVSSLRKLKKLDGSLFKCNPRVDFPINSWEAVGLEEIMSFVRILKSWAQCRTSYSPQKSIEWERRH